MARSDELPPTPRSCLCFQHSFANYSIAVGTLASLYQANYCSYSVVMWFRTALDCGCYVYYFDCSTSCWPSSPSSGKICYWLHDRDCYSWHYLNHAKKVDFPSGSPQLSACGSVRWQNYFDGATSITLSGPMAVCHWLHDALSFLLHLLKLYT